MSEISPGEFEGRQETARRAAAGRGLDALLVIGRSFYDRPGDLAYLTNHFPPFPATAFSGTIRGMGHGLFLLPVRGRPALLIDGRSYRKDLVVVDEVRASLDLATGLAGLLQDRELRTGRIGLVGEDIMPVALMRAVASALPGVTFEPAGDIVSGLRVVKSAGELAALRRAALVAGRGLEAAVRRIGPAARENQVCAAGVSAALEAGADFVRYLRVHSGPWSALGSRWPQATDRPMVEGDVVTLDIIGAVEGYQFDVLRSTTVGPAAGDARRMLEACLAAVERTVAAVRPGTAAEALVTEAGRAIEAAGLGPYASTFVGHGIGLETVEEPYLMPGVTTPLRAGMVLCIEPGIYVPERWGCSIEQEVIVREGPPEVIIDFPTRLW